MDADALMHLERIEALVAKLVMLPWFDPEHGDRARDDLLNFDATYWPFLRMLVPPLYAELMALLAADPAAIPWRQPPELAVVIPVHEPRRELLHACLASLRQQVGVAITCLISIDGRDQDRRLVEQVLAELDALTDQPLWSVKIFASSENLGVGRCRNRALRQITCPYFTCLDADDIFHPLRCLHALLLLRQLAVERLNTGWSRVSLTQKKLVLINGVLASHGHNSFVASSSLLDRYGYLADLRVHEDTEYQQRLQFFNVAMQATSVVGHFLNTEVTAGYRSLSTPLRRDVQVIEGHPYLCGSVIAEADQERLRIDRHYQQYYQQLLSEALQAAFPPI